MSFVCLSCFVSSASSQGPGPEHMLNKCPLNDQLDAFSRPLVSTSGSNTGDLQLEAIQGRLPSWRTLFSSSESCPSCPSSCSASQSCLTLCDPMNCSTPGFPALHRLLKFAQTHAHWVSDAPLGAMTFSESSRLLETAGYLFLGGGESVVEGRVLEREQLCSPSFGVYVHFSILILLCY